MAQPPVRKRRHPPSGLWPGIPPCPARSAGPAVGATTIIDRWNLPPGSATASASVVGRDCSNGRIPTPSCANLWLWHDPPNPCRFCQVSSSRTKPRDRARRLERMDPRPRRRTASAAAPRIRHPVRPTPIMPPWHHWSSPTHKRTSIDI